VTDMTGVIDLTWSDWYDMSACYDTGDWYDRSNWYDMEWLIRHGVTDVTWSDWYDEWVICSLMCREQRHDLTDRTWADSSSTIHLVARVTHTPVPRPQVLTRPVLTHIGVDSTLVDIYNKMTQFHVVNKQQRLFEITYHHGYILTLHIPY